MYYTKCNTEKLPAWTSSRFVTLCPIYKLLVNYLTCVPRHLFCCNWEAWPWKPIAKSTNVNGSRSVCGPIQFRKHNCSTSPVSFDQTETHSTHSGPSCRSAFPPPPLIWSSPAGRHRERGRTRPRHLCDWPASSPDRRGNDAQSCATKTKQ